MLESLQQFTRDIGRDLARTWENLADGWRELLARSGNALTRFNRGEQADAGATGLEAEVPHWGLLAGDVSDDGRQIVVRLELPGVDREDCEIVVDGAMLYIRGEKRHDVEHIGNSYYARQCAYGSFQRAIALPHGVDASQAEASFRKGVLTVKLPKSPATQPRRIAVK